MWGTRSPTGGWFPKPGAAPGCRQKPDSSMGGRGSFLRLYRRGHLRNAGLRVEGEEIYYAFDEVSRRNRAVRFDLESIPIPGNEALKISLRPEMPVEETRFDLGFAAAAERKYIRCGALARRGSYC